MSDYTVETINDGLTEFNVEFHGPKESIFLLLLLNCFFQIYFRNDWSSRLQFRSVKII